MSLRVAFILGPFPNISETFIQRQAIGLLELGLDVHLFPEKIGNGTLEYRLQHRVHYPTSLRRFIPNRLQKTIFEQIEKQGSFEIIHHHFGHIAAKYPLLKTQFPRSKWIATFHGYDANVAPQKSPNLYRKMIQDVDLITANSEFLSKRVAALGFDASRIRRLPVGI